MMTMTECLSDQQIQQLALGQIAEEESDIFFEHIDTCDSCRSLLEQVEDADDSLVAVLREPDDLQRFDGEPSCRLAIGKALDAHSLIDTAGAGDATHVPTHIGEYALVRPLGRGGMGNVFLARHSKLNREVALKVLANHRLLDPRMQRRFEAEMRAIGQLNHPNIVTAHDAREIEGTAVLVTELINGLDLEQTVNRVGPLSTADACEIVGQIANALAYINEQGFVHRDVKPSNIMLSETGEVKLLDLGLARLQYGDPEHSEITGAGHVVGTADYVAPEQVSDCRQVDIRADLYSLGCTLFKLLMGRPPFSGPQYATAFAKLTAHVSDEPPSLSSSLPDAPPELVQLLKSLLAKNPDHRPQSPEDVSQALAEFSLGSDLKGLIAKALSLPAKPVSPPRSTNAPTNAKRLPFFQRNVPMSIAIAGGLTGLILGVCLGIIITITHPDGSKTVIEPSEDSRVEIQNNKQSQPKHEPNKPPKVSLEKQLQGVWRGVSVVSGDKTVDLGKSIHLLAFEGNEYFQVLDGKFDEAGTFTTKSASSMGSHSIDMNDQFGNAGKTLGILRILSNGELQVSVRNSPASQRPTSFAGTESGTQQRVVTFEKMTDSLYANPLSMRELHDPTKRPLFQAMSELIMAHQMGPKNLKHRVETVQRSVETAKTRLHLKQIGLAFLNYHDAYRKLPGTANHHASDKKKLYPYSWRVAILPFIQQNELYEQYHFDEPWDSEHNLALLDRMPAIYRSPFAKESQKAGHTNYQGFAGEQTALGTGDGLPLKEIEDGTANTLLVIDSEETVPWTKPSDLPFPTPPGQKMDFSREEIPYVAVDGAVRSLAVKDRNQLSAWITRNGRETIVRTPNR